MIAPSDNSRKPSLAARVRVVLSRTSNEVNVARASGRSISLIRKPQSATRSKPSFHCEGSSEPLRQHRHQTESR